MCGAIRSVLLFTSRSRCGLTEQQRTDISVRMANIFSPLSDMTRSRCILQGCCSEKGVIGTAHVDRLLEEIRNAGCATALGGFGHEEWLVKLGLHISYYEVVLFWLFF